MRANGYAQELFAVRVGDGFRQAGGLTAEYQHVAGPIRNIKVVARGPFAEQVGLTAAEPLEQRRPVIDNFPLQMFPVIEAGAAKIIIIDTKAQWPHQPQLAAGGHARSAHGAGVVRNFRVMQNNMQ